MSRHTSIFRISDCQRQPAVFRLQSSDTQQNDAEHGCNKPEKLTAVFRGVARPRKPPGVITRAADWTVYRGTQATFGAVAQAFSPPALTNIFFFFTFSPSAASRRICRDVCVKKIHSFYRDLSLAIVKLPAIAFTCADYMVERYSHG